MSGPSLNQNFNQTQTLAPQMRQSLEVLQANTLELQQLLQQFLETNPVLEHELASVSLDDLDSNTPDPDPLLEVPDDDLRELAIMERRANGSTRDDEERREHLYSSIVSPETLQQHLLDQLNLAAPEPDIRTAAMALIGNMDERGYFDEPLSEVGRRLGIDIKNLERSKILLQSFDPPGIAVEDLQESLLLQLHRSGRLNTLEFRIVENHLNDLAQNLRAPPEQSH